MKGWQYMSMAMLTCLGIPLLAFLLYAGAAAWSLRGAEQRAAGACRLVVAGSPVDGYLAQLAEAGFDAQVSRDAAGRIDLVMVSARSVALSRFVCLAPVEDGVVGQASVRYVD